MSVIMVSLFLPYSIDFEKKAGQNTPKHHQKHKGQDYFGIVYPGNTAGTASVPTSYPGTPVAPAPSTPEGLTPGTSVVLPPGTPAAELDAFLFGVPKHGNRFLEPGDPKSLRRSDNYISEFAPGILFNQPTSRAEEAPPSLLVANALAQVPDSRNMFAANQRRRRARGSMSAEPLNFASFDIVPAERGNGGIANAIMAAQRDFRLDVLFLGTIGFASDALSNEVKRDISGQLEQKYNALAVYPCDSDFDGHYSQFCKTILWPVFHYIIPDHPKSKAYQDNSWKYYQRLNQTFADKIVADCKRDDVIWIHDYHLLLVPQMVRKKCPDAKIGFFLHVAFPSSEVFRCLANRKELLEGMLGANLIAFQAAEYLEHFISTCSRLLVVEATADGVQLEDRFVNVIAQPIGLDPKGITNAQTRDDVKEALEKVKLRYVDPLTQKPKRLIVAQDKLDNVSGVRQKLLAFELFLARNESYVEDVVLIQVASFTPEENKLLDEIVAEIANRIVSKHGSLTHQPLYLLRQDVSFATYMALFSYADALLVTSLREGFNLTCHEFVLVQDGEHGGKRHAPVILSEFTGSSALFQDKHLPVNPWDFSQTANAIKTALDMSEEEKSKRYTALKEIVMNNTGSQWVRNLVDKLNKVHASHQSKGNTSVPRLSISRVANSYRESKQRLFFLDYEGTLLAQLRSGHVYLTTPQRTLNAITHMVLDKRNTIYIMSSRKLDEVERDFSRVPNVGIIAENGCRIRFVDSDERKDFPDKEETHQWKHSILPILHHYAMRIENSKIVEREYGMAVLYEDAPDESAAKQVAGECALHINDACKSLQVQATPIDKSLWIEPTKYHKGSAALHAYDRFKQRNNGVDPDFIFAVASDAESELFKWANALGRDKVVKNVFTASVGRRNTEAASTLTADGSGLLSLLQRLVRN